MEISEDLNTVIWELGHAFNNNPNINKSHPLCYWELIKKLFDIDLEKGPYWIYFLGANAPEVVDHKLIGDERYYLKIDMELSRKRSDRSNHFSFTQPKEFWDAIDEISEKKKTKSFEELFEERAAAYVAAYTGEHDFEDISQAECFISGFIDGYHGGEERGSREEFVKCCELLKKFRGINEKFDKKYLPR